MGLFSLFSKKPDQLEAAGDRLFAGDSFGPAKIEYEKALNLLESKPWPDPDLKPRVLEKLRKTREALAEQHLDRARSYAEEGLTDDAMTYYSLALELTGEPDLKSSIEDEIRGVGHLSAGNAGDPEDREAFREPVPEQEISDLDEFHAVIGTYPDDMAEAYLSYGGDFREGLLALERGDDETALPLLEKAVKDLDQPRNYMVLELARALHHTGDTARAEELLRGFLEWQPRSIHGISRLCEVLGSTERHAEARDFLLSLPEELQEIRECRLLLGYAHMGAGEHHEALEVYQSFLKTHPDDVPTARALARALETMGRLEEARSVLGTMLSSCTACGRRPSAEDRLHAADLAVKAGQTSRDLVDVYRGIAMEMPEAGPHCLAQTARILRENGDPAEASRIEAMLEASKRQE